MIPVVKKLLMYIYPKFGPHLIHLGEHGLCGADVGGLAADDHQRVAGELLLQPEADVT
jgi:hypothetical protein